MDQNPKISTYYIFGFIAVALAIYFPSWENGFVTDWMSWIYWYQEGTYADVIHCFGYPGLHQFFHLVHYTLYKICGTDHFMWYIPYAIMHGVNAFLVLKLIRAATDLYQIKAGAFIAWFTALVFFISPYQVETVVWKVCFHYMMSLALIMGSWWYLIKYLRDDDRTFLTWHHILFVLALLTLEITLAAPFMFFTFSLIFLYRNDLLTQKWKQLAWTFGIQLGIIVLYFLANRAILGSWVGHYGAEQHLKFDAALIGGNGMKYLWKYLLFTHYWPYTEKMELYNSFDTDAINIGGGLLVLSLIALFVVYKLKSLKTEISLAFFGIVAFFMGIFPIANLFFMRMHPYENDRYGYFASAFFYLFIICLIACLPKVWRYIVAVLYTLISVYLFVGMMKTANDAGHIHRELVRSFDYYDRDDIVFLTKPDNFNGMCIFRDLSGEAVAFRESLDLFEGKPYTGKMIDIAQINMVSPTDGVRVAQIDSLTIQVAINSGGTWFWRSGFGLLPYKTDEFEVTKGEWHYRVHFYEDPSDKTFLYFIGDEWKEFRFE